MAAHAAFGGVTDHLTAGGNASFTEKKPGFSMGHALSMNWMQKPKK